MSLEERLTAFTKRHNFRRKGAICVVLVVTRRAISEGLPLASNRLLTKAGGQVAGLGKSAVQSILNDHGIRRVLAEEGGRTSRGSIENMQAYVAFLNSLEDEIAVDLDLVERWWIKQVESFFAAKPFKFRLDRSASIRSMVRDLLDQALKRQKEMPGTMYAGVMLQHLVGAKLELVLPAGTVTHHGAFVADAPSDREGDFTVADTAIHVTTAPTEALIRKCRRNLDADVRPVIVTTQDGAQGAHALAKTFGIEGRIDVLEIEQFIATNVYEWSEFGHNRRRVAISELLDVYNSIVELHETDPSLRIELAR